MNDLVQASGTEMPAVKEGPIVAVQYPSTVNYSLTPEKIQVLVDTYAHLVDVDHTDSAAVQELKAAISDVKRHRTDCQKEEDTIKKPLNKFRSLVISIGKGLRESIQPLEDRLTAEMARIEQIKAEEERKFQERQKWQENLEIVRAKGNNLFGLTLEQLQGRLEIIDCCNLDDLELGDYLAEAQQALENSALAVTNAISQERQRLEIVRQQEEFAAKQAAAAEKEANNSPINVKEGDTFVLGDTTYKAVAPVPDDGQPMKFRNWNESATPEDFGAVGDSVEAGDGIEDLQRIDSLIRDVGNAFLDAAPYTDYDNKEVAAAVEKVLKTIGNAYNFLKHVREENLK